MSLCQRLNSLSDMDEPYEEYIDEPPRDHQAPGYDENEWVWSQLTSSECKETKENISKC